MPSSRVNIFARQFLFLFHGNFGATDEHCCLAILMISCQRQIVSRCKCICLAELEPALVLLRVNYKRVDAVLTVSHVGLVLPGAKLTSFWFPLGASRWWGLWAGGPVGSSPLLDYPPSSGMTAASSATESSFAKFICDLVHVVSVQGSVVTSFPGSLTLQPLSRGFLVSQAPCPLEAAWSCVPCAWRGVCGRSCQAGTCLVPRDIWY